MTKPEALALARKKFGPDADAFPETLYLNSQTLRFCVLTDGVPRKGATRFVGRSWEDAARTAELIP